MKKRQTSVFKNLFVMVCVILWFVIILFSLYILKTGGHLRPRAAGLDAVKRQSVVLGEGDSGVKDAKVILTRDGRNNYYISDSRGQFVIINLDYGNYDLNISASGYRDYNSRITIDREGQNFSFKLVK